MILVRNGLISSNMEIWLPMKQPIILILNIKNSFSKEYFGDATFDLWETENAIPNSVHEKNLEFVWDKKFYAITFRK